MEQTQWSLNFTRNKPRLSPVLPPNFCTAARLVEVFDPSLIRLGGGSESKSHLMRVAALAWCTEIPGLQVYLFRRLSDDLAKNHMEGPSGFPELLAEWVDSGLVKFNGSKNFIEFWNGAKIHLCHCQYEKDLAKYQGAEIHCSEENERVRMADGSFKRIAEVKVGDFVSTLQGARRVAWVGDRELKQCVTAKVSYRGSVTQQIHSATHKILTPTGWVSYVDIANESRQPLTCESTESHSSHKCDELFASELRSGQQFHGIPCQDSVRKGESSQLLLGHQSGLETCVYEAQQALGSDSELSLCDTQESDKPSLGFSFPVVLHAPSRNREGAVSQRACRRGAKSCAQIECTHEGCQYDCHPSCGSRGEYQCDDSDKSHGVAHKQGGALEHIPKHLPLDGLDTVQKCIPLAQLQYDHPYTGEERTAEEAVCLGTCVLTPCGEKWTIDLMIEGENHYITESGLVNKNCLLLDELTHFSEKIYRYLRGRCRIGGLKVPTRYTGQFPRIVAGSNPGGVGHNWVRATFVNAAPPMEVVRQPKAEGGMLRQFIPAKLQDNPTLMTNDPDYLDRLEGLGDAALVKAMRDGDWNIVSGGALDDVWSPRVTVPRFSVPPSWRVDRSFDWGSTHPFSVLWWGEADGTEATLDDGSKFCPPRGSLVLAHEWYGSKGPNEGLKMSPRDVAKGIVEREAALLDGAWIASKPKAGPADNQISAVSQPGTPTIADEMSKEGVRWELSDKAPGSRKIGLELMRSRLRESSKDRPENPALYVMSHCINALSNWPVLPRDPRNPDDVDTSAVDHDYDSARYRILAAKRPAMSISLRSATN